MKLMPLQLKSKITTSQRIKIISFTSSIEKKSCCSDNVEKCDRPEMHCNQFTPDHCSQDSVRKECPFTCGDCKSSGIFHILSNIYTH